MRCSHIFKNDKNKILIYVEINCKGEQNTRNLFLFDLLLTLMFLIYVYFFNREK